MGQERGVALLVLAASCLQLASAQTYYYYGDCPYACSRSSPTPSYGNCIYTCQNCLYWAYWAFVPYFDSAGSFYTYSCYKYLSWWAWLLIALSIALVVFCCVYAVLMVVRRQREKKEMAPPPESVPYGAPPPGAGPAPEYASESKV